MLCFDYGARKPITAKIASLWVKNYLRNETTQVYDTMQAALKNHYISFYSRRSTFIISDIFALFS